MSTVFVVAESPKHNIAPALDYGEIEVVLPPSQSQVIFSSGPTKNHGRYKCLKWDKQERRYLPIQIDIFPHKESDDD